ncbi:MAG: hypothetical protein K9G44_08775, partial [Melioribacteraceae bacterium]|nr:hypothetical protein [Melioribacteraceae bacterium]
MLIKKIKYSLVFLLFICNFNFAQNRDYSFLHLNKSLSQNTITTIFEDHLGFIWIGTAHGLNRYDGMEVLIFENHSEDSSSISDNYIRKIVEDKNGDLWIATVNGLNKYDRAQNIFVRYFNEPGNYRSLASNNVSDVWVDSKSRIWVSAESLCLFDAGKNEFVRFEAPTESSNLTRDPYHNFIYEDNGQNIWYGYWSDLFKFNENKQRLEVVLGGSKNNFGEPGWHYHEMIQDSQSSYWLATNRGGLIKLEMNTDGYTAQRFNDKITTNSELSDYRILTVFIDHRNELWVSCENAGLFLFDVNRKLKKHFVSKPGESTSISGNSIWTIFEDRSNRLWFGSWNVGIDLIDPLNIKFAHYNSYGIKSRLSHNIATDFLEDEAGNLWIATDGGGINYFNRESDEFTYYQNNLNGRFELSSDAVLCLTYDNRGRIWAGTWNGGINILDLKSGKAEILNTTNSGLTSNDIFDLLYDGKEKIYIATYRGGLNIFNLRSGKVENYLPLEGDFNSISSSNLFVLYQDSEESIWIGSLGEGLNKLVEDEQVEISFLRYQYFENIDNGLSD